MKKTVLTGLALLFLLAVPPLYSQVTVPENLRNIIPEHPEQNLVAAFSSDTSDTVLLSIPVAYVQVTAFYKNHFAGSGWKTEMEMSLEGGNILSFVKNGRLLNLMLSRDGEASTSVSITLEDR